jgi:hypothetical protein
VGEGELLAGATHDAAMMLDRHPPVNRQFPASRDRVQDKILRLGADVLDFQVRGERFSLSLEEGRGEADPID